MLKSVLRQRRRIAFAFLMTQLALFHVWPNPLIFVAATMAILVFSSVLIAVGGPSRRLVECGTVGLYVATMMPTPEQTAIAHLAVMALVYGVFYTPVLDRLAVRIGMRSQKKFQSPNDRSTTWKHIIPGEGSPADYWTGTMLTSRKDQDDDQTLYLTFQQDGQPTEEVTVTYLVRDHEARAAYLLEHDRQAFGEEVIVSYRLAKATDEFTTIVSDMHVNGLPIRIALSRFFDDVLGDELDRYAPMTEWKRSWSVGGLSQGGLMAQIADAQQPLPGAEHYEEEPHLRLLA